VDNTVGAEAVAKRKISLPRHCRDSNVSHLARAVINRQITSLRKMYKLYIKL